MNGNANLKRHQLNDYKVLFSDILSTKHHTVLVDGVDVRVARAGHNQIQSLTWSAKNGFNSIRKLVFGIYMYNL